MKWELWMILFSAEAILASSTSKFGIAISLIDDENIISSTESLFLIQKMNSFRRKSWTSTYLGLQSYLPVSKCCWCKELVKMKISDLQSLLLRWQNLWLTVQTDIVDLDLVFVSHSFPLWMNGATLRYWNSMDLIPADTVQKMTHLDVQKTFPDIPCVPNTWRPFSAARRYERMPQHPFRYRMRWEWHWSTDKTANWFSTLKISWIIHTTNFILQFLYLFNKFQSSILIFD